MKKHFFICLLALLMGHTANATLKPYATYIGKPGSVIRADTEYPDEYRYDTLTTELFIFEKKSLNVFIFNDTIFKIIVINDGTLFDEPSTIDTTYEDKVMLQKFEQYFTKKYQVKPDFKTVPTGLGTLRQEFGLACGPAGMPTALGARYLTQSENYSAVEVKHLLLSFDPNDRLIGLLLYNKKPIEELAPVAQGVSSNPFEFKFCYGCVPGMKPTKTAKEISLFTQKMEK